MKNRGPALLNAVLGDPEGTTWALPEGANARFGKGKTCCGVKMSPDGKHFVIGTSIGLWWYDVFSMLPISLWETEQGVSNMAFSHDGKWIVINNKDYIVKVLNVQSGECIYKMNTQDAFGGLTISSNGKWIATADIKGIVKVLDIHQGICIGQMDRGKHEWRSNDISQLEFSPDGNLLAGTAQNSKLYSPDDSLLNPDTEGEQTYVWHPETGEVILKFAGRDFVFSADSRLLASASADDDHSFSDTERVDRCVSVWDMKNGERVSHFTEHTDWVESVVFSPCGKFIASSDETLRVWDVATGTQKKVYENCHDAFYSPDGVLFGVVFPSDGTMEIWNLEPRERVHKIPRTRVNNELAKSIVTACMQEHQYQIPEIISNERSDIRKWAIPVEHRIHFSVPDPIPVWLDNRTLASGSIRQGIVLWDIVENRVRDRLMPDEDIHSFTVLPNGKMLATLAIFLHDTTKVWDVDKPDKPIAEFCEDLWWERHERFAPTGEYLAAGSNDGPVYVWNLQQPEHPIQLTGHTGHIYSLAFSPDGKRLVTSSDDKTARLWDVKAGKEISILPMDKPCIPIGVTFSPCGTLIAGGMDNEIRLWCTEQLTTLRTLLQPETNQRTYALAFSPCGRYLASGTWWQNGMKKMAIRLWNVATGENIHTFWGHPTDIQSLAFSPNNTLLASGSFDGTILLWDIKPYLRDT